jgi:biotin carboxylase
VNYWKVILATVVIFGAGVFTGGLMINSVERSHPRFHRSPSTIETHPTAEAREPQSHTNYNPGNLPRPRPPEILGDKFVQQLDDALQLTSDQRASIQKIITDGQDRNRSIWTNNSAQMRMVIQDVRRRVREALNADQQKQFEDLMKRSPRRQNSTNAPASLSPTNAPGV